MLGGKEQRNKLGAQQRGDRSEGNKMPRTSCSQRHGEAGEECVEEEEAEEGEEGAIIVTGRRGSVGTYRQAGLDVCEEVAK